MTAAIIGLAVSAMTTAMGGIMAYTNSKRQNEQLKDQQRAVKQQADAQAAELEKQSTLEEKRAGIAQIQGEQEAEKRSRILAQDIGSTYANYAGNGLLVDGSAKDSIGAALRTQAAEAQSDISTIQDNAAMNVWTHQANAASYRASAGNTRIAARNQIAMLKSQRKAARHQGKLGLWQTFTGLPLVNSTGAQMAMSSAGMMKFGGGGAGGGATAQPNYAGTSWGAGGGAGVSNMA